jgi:hypothetical protein
MILCAVAISIISPVINKLLEKLDAKYDYKTTLLIGFVQLIIMPVWGMSILCVIIGTIKLLYNLWEYCVVDFFL